MPEAWAQSAPKRVALVIGNAGYADKPLKNPVNDATDLKAALEAAGFSVTLLTNAGADRMKEAIADFSDQLAKDGAVGLFYFSGHGVQTGKGNYLLPVARSFQRERDVELFAVEARAVLDQMARARNPLNIVILDACRDSPLPATERSAGSKGLARMDAPSGSVIAFSTAPGRTASDNTSGRNGLYTKHLISALKADGLTLEAVFRRVGAAVEKENPEQSPEEVMKLRSEEPFYFKPARPSASRKPQEQVASVKPEPVEPGLDLSDLDRQHAQEADRQWREQAALTRMQGDFDKVAAFTGTASLQATGWERFLAAWSDDKLPGDGGRSLKAQAQRRLAKAREAARQPVQTAQVGGGGKVCAECPETVLLQPGSFQMGSPDSEEGRSKDEGPAHSVTIGYKLAVGKTHVTKGEFAAYVNATGYRTEAEQGDGCYGWTGSKFEQSSSFSWRNVGFEQASDHPVVCVSWNDAQKYIAWLNEKSPVKGWRLLSEAEHEYGARAGTSTRYWWGDDNGNSQQCQFANGADQSAKRTWNPSWTAANCDDGNAYTAPVGRFKANAWGLYDMAGNALSWTQDCYASSYDGAPTDGSAVTSSSCSQRVLRGGSWIVNPQGLRSAYRVRFTPVDRVDFTGFRLARTVF